MLSRPALSNRTKPPPDGQFFTRPTVSDLPKRLPLTPERYHFPNARGSALREW
jgi:hypothetical protein